ncbi:MAG: AMP-binding protein [Desulfobacterales bacterium]|nr:AMP-binding protein [Desulfobacterales bacterium]
MKGLMMEVPMLLSGLIDYAAECHGETEVVGRRLDGQVERRNYRTLRKQAAKLANALIDQGYGLDSRMASLAWNTVNHIEVFYGVLGIGASLHTLNPRLSAENIAYMSNKVDNELIFVDGATIGLAEQLQDKLTNVKGWVFLDENEPMPATTLKNIVVKSDLVKTAAEDIEWPQFDERQAATICFTSGTTGKPKGVVYSHRSTTLSAMNMTMADMYGGYINGDLMTVMPIAPIFHANGWQMPFTAPMNGHKLVLPGRDFTARALIDLINNEEVTMIGAVPTLYMDLFSNLKPGETFSALRIALIAGTRVPDKLFELFDQHGIEVGQQWGMTETPGCTRGTLPPGVNKLPKQEREIIRRKNQGRIAFSAKHRIIDENGNPLPHDGIACGEMQVRGNNVAGRYLGQSEEEQFDWLSTGDVACISPDGRVEIVDRTKDVIKSGGEWISTQILESAASDHPAVDRVAVISIPHPRFQERPLMLVKLKENATCTQEELLNHLRTKVESWWLPDRIEFIDDVAVTSTGKLDKIELRRQFTGRTTQMVI